MLRLSTRGRYGVRIMLELALNYGKGPMLLKEIARKQEVSVGYLEQIMPSLKASGLIGSSRGAHGGYFLIKEPSKVSMKDIVNALEGSIAIVECLNNPKTCNRSASCASRELWEGLTSKMIKFLDSKSLQDLVNSQYEKEGKSSDTYEI